MEAACLRRLLEIAEPVEAGPAGGDDWSVPERGVVLCVRMPVARDQEHEREEGDGQAEGDRYADAVPAAWGAAVPVVLDAPYCFLVVDVADRARMLREVDAVLRPERVCVSSPVTPDRLPDAARLTRRLHGLAAIGIVADAEVLDCADHELMLWLYAEPVLRQRVATRLLWPLQRETPHRRRMLAVTLLTWLERRRSANALADELEVHPQTVRYRMRQLQDMFGEALDEPETAFALMLALKATLPLWTASLPAGVDV